MSYITLDQENITSEHICCAFSDKKCTDSYEQKKQWLSNEFENGYVFRRIDERAKVFIEYGPAENAWVPVVAPGYLVLGCFWVSGKYKGNGHGKALLKEAIKAGKAQEKQGLVAIVGAKKFHFMSDTKWLLRQGFEVVEEIADGFVLLALKFKKGNESPRFAASVRSGAIAKKKGLVVYYSNRCPYSEYHVQNSLVETAKKRDLRVKIIKFETREQAQNSPSPATIFSLYLDGKFVTTDLSACMDSRFDKITGS